jgi:hypothetical protein
MLAERRDFAVKAGADIVVVDGVRAGTAPRSTCSTSTRASPLSRRGGKLEFATQARAWGESNAHHLEPDDLAALTVYRKCHGEISTRRHPLDSRPPSVTKFPPTKTDVALIRGSLGTGAPPLVQLSSDPYCDFWVSVTRSGRIELNGVVRANCPD